MFTLIYMYTCTYIYIHLYMYIYMIISALRVQVDTMQREAKIRESECTIKNYLQDAHWNTLQHTETHCNTPQWTHCNSLLCSN